jgi:hypothetical protein
VTAAYFNYPISLGLIEATVNQQAASEAGVHAVVTCHRFPHAGSQEQRRAPTLIAERC